MESQICENAPGRGAASPLIPDLEPSFRQNISPRGYECRMLGANGENAVLCFQSFAHCPPSLPSKIALCFVTLAHCSARKPPVLIIMHHALCFFSASQTRKIGRVPDAAKPTSSPTASSCKLALPSHTPSRPGTSFPRSSL